MAKSVFETFIRGEEAGRQARRFPLEQQQRQSSIRQQEMALDQSQTKFNQQQALQGAQVMSRVVDRLKQIPDVNARFQTFKRVQPELETFGIQGFEQVTPEDFTDEGLVPLETGLGQTIQSLTSGQRDLETRAQALVGSKNPETGEPFTLQTARQAIVARDAGIVGKEGASTFKERASRTPEDVRRIADLEQQLADAKARGAGEGKISSDTIKSSLDSIGNLEKNNSNLKRALNALDRGGRTGTFQKFLPNLTEASKELKQIQNELGLDVIGSVTFGALSEGELNLALATALDLSQDEPDLKLQIRQKIEAQEKLVDYLDQQIEFLEDGGTPGEWRAIVRDRGKRTSSVNQGGEQNAQLIQEARQAIAQGAPREAVLQRLQEMGVSLEGL